MSCVGPGSGVTMPLNTAPGSYTRTFQHEQLASGPNGHCSVCCRHRRACAVAVVCALALIATSVGLLVVFVTKKPHVETIDTCMAKEGPLPPTGTADRLVVHPGPVGGVGIGYRNVQSRMYQVHVRKVVGELTPTTEAFVYDAPNRVPTVEGVGAGTHFTMFDIDPGVAVQVIVTVLGTQLQPVATAFVRPDRYNATARVQSPTTVVVHLHTPGHYYVNVNGYPGSHDTPLLLFVEQPEGPIAVDCGRAVIDVPSVASSTVRYFERGFHQTGTIDVAAGNTVYLAPGAYVNGSIKAGWAKGVVVRGRGVLSGEVLKVVDQVHSSDRQPVPYRYNGIDFAVTSDGGSGANWNLVEGVTVLYPPGYSTNFIDAPSPLQVLFFKAIAYRYSSDGLALPAHSSARWSFLKVNDDSLNAGWASHVRYQDIVTWPGDNSAVIQLSWGAAAGMVIEDVQFRRIDVLARAGTVPWAREIQQGSSSLIAVTQMRGATIRDILISDVVVYDDMATLLGISVNVGDPAFGATFPGGIPIGFIQDWTIEYLNFLCAEIGVGYRGPASQDQISLIQTGTPIKSWVYLQDPSDGSFVRNLAFTRLLFRGQCVSELSQWPGFQVVGSAGMSFSC